MGSKVNYISPSMLFHMYGFQPNTYDKINLTSNTLKNLNFNDFYDSNELL